CRRQIWGVAPATRHTWPESRHPRWVDVGLSQRGPKMTAVRTVERPAPDCAPLGIRFNGGGIHWLLARRRLAPAGDASPIVQQACCVIGSQTINLLKTVRL